MTMARIMAVDVGEVHLGVALSDELKITAQPFKTIGRTSLKRDLRALARLANDHEVVEIVVGLPLRMAGDIGPAAEATLGFVEQMRHVIRHPIRTWDERLTTVQAERALLESGTSRRRRRERIDQVAAAIILQSYLDSRSEAGT
ncbi:MAG: Holliday junction resolvase RuvX [Acidobacteriota bacterium]